MAKYASFRELIVWQKGMDLAEGFSRRSAKAYRAHVAIALGSQAEVQTLLELSGRLSLIDQGVVERLQELAAAVCYSVALLVAFLGLLPGAWGQIVHGFSLFS